MGWRRFDGTKYFEVWNEPDGLPFATRAACPHRDVYKTRTLANCGDGWPLLFGDPPIRTFNGEKNLRALFLQYLQDHKPLPDFYNVNTYTQKSKNPTDSRVAQNYRADLDPYRLTITQIVNSLIESIPGDSTGNTGNAQEINAPAIGDAADMTSIGES